MEVSMSSEALKELMGEAILRSIDQKTRDELIKNAIASLIVVPKKKNYYDSESPLQEAFEFAAGNLCRDLVREMMLKDEAFRASIRSLIVSAVERATTNKLESISNTIGNAISNAICKES